MLVFGMRSTVIERAMVLLVVSVIWTVGVVALASPDAAGATTGTGGPVAQSTPSYTVPDRVECSDAPTDFVPLCRAHELITEQYVDAVSSRSLAGRAAQYVRDAGLTARTTDDPPACPLPTADFEQVCQQIDAVQDTAGGVWEAIKGMVSLLDSQSFLWTNDDYAAVEARAANIQAGIGIELALLDGEDPCEEVSSTCRPVILNVYEGSPAATAGLQEGDILVELNGPLPSGLSCSDIPGLDNFADEETVVVEVTRDSNTVTATMQATELTVPVARGRVVHTNVGYLRLDRFNSSAATATETELTRLTGIGIGALVFDLRDNPGGSVSSTVDTAGLFLADPSVVIRLVYRSGEETGTATGGALAADPDLLPMTIAVDGRSASGAEAFAGALTDHERATVVGKRTFGKNTGQSTYELKNGDDNVIGVLRLTVLRWLTSQRRSVAGGIAPDTDMDLPRCLHPTEVARRAVAHLRTTVSGLAVTSTPVNGNAYTPGQTVEVTVTFSKPVVVDTTDGTPALDVTVGTTDRPATYESGSGTADLRFRYTVAAGESDGNGIEVGSDSLATNGGTIRHRSGLDVSLEHDRLPPDRNHPVTSSVPTEVALTVDPASVWEDAGSPQISVTASLKPGTGTHPDALTVPVSLPSNPSQYSSTTAQVRIPAGQVSGSAPLVVTPVDDAESEGRQQVQVSGTLAGFTITPATLIIEDDETAPDFGADSTSRSVTENSPPGTDVGTPVAAVDPNGDTPTYSLDGPDRHPFTIDTAGQITVRPGGSPDYEALATYVLTVTATDQDNNRDTIEVTITVTDEEEEGTVNLPSSQPVVGTELVATVTDPDGEATGELWTWESSSDRTTWEHLQTSESPAYTPSASDAGKYLRASVFYTDPRGSGKQAHWESSTPVRTSRSTNPGPTRPQPPPPRDLDPGPVEPPPPVAPPVPQFTDIEGTVHRQSIERIAAAGITQGCGSGDDGRYCPNQPVTRAQMATFLTHTLDLPPTDHDYFTDDNGTTHEDNINRLAAAGITQGCGQDTNDQYCPNQPVTRAQMATFLTHTLDLPPTDHDYFTDDNGTTHEDNINRLAAAGITQGCGQDTNDQYCPNQPVTRAQMATFLARVLGRIAVFTDLSGARPS